MLVLTRKTNEWIDIGSEIEICVVEIRGDKVRLGIKAPTKVMIHRREVTEAIRQHMQQSGDFPTC